MCSGRAAAALAMSCLLLNAASAEDQNEHNVTEIWFELDRPLRLDCTLADSDVRYKWYKEGTLLKQGGAVWSAEAARDSDAGLYACYIGDELSGSWRTRAIPTAALPNITDAKEGARITLECTVRAAAEDGGEVRWYRAPADERAANATPVGLGAVLRLRAYADAAGTYWCAPGGQGAREASTELRVNEAASAWPSFLACAAEAALLCAALLLWERRGTSARRLSD